jgi:mono/diheme cytochrome c family protein
MGLPRNGHGFPASSKSNNGVTFLYWIWPPRSSASAIMVKEDSANRMKTGNLLRYSLLVTMMAALNLICVAATGRETTRKQAWRAPASETAKKNPVGANEESIKAGEKVYGKFCIKCHGKTGNGDGPDSTDLGVHPAKFSDPQLRGESDGEFYWKITVGKKPMPGYKTRLSEADRWNVINYVRTLAK